MTNEELFRKNQQLSAEFELYLLEHTEVEEKIPDIRDLIPPELRSRDKKIVKELKKSHNGPLRIIAGNSEKGLIATSGKDSSIAVWKYSSAGTDGSAR